jgi:hypothetical protein
MSPPNAALNSPLPVHGPDLWWLPNTFGVPSFLGGDRFGAMIAVSCFTWSS